MAKKKKPRKNKPKRQQQHNRFTPTSLPPHLSWMDEDRLHAILPGEAPSKEMMTVFNDNFRKELRNSPLWHEMVENFGEEQAEKLLKQVNVEVKR